MSSKKLVLIFIAVIFTFSVRIEGQAIGKIIHNKEARILFGPVVDSVQINISMLNKMITDTKKVAMFLIKKNKVIIKGDKGKILYNQGVSADSTDIFNVFSISTLKKFLASADSTGAKKVTIQKRSTVMSLSTSDLTLEFGIGCPPFCD